MTRPERPTHGYEWAAMGHNDNCACTITGSPKEMEVMGQLCGLHCRPAISERTTAIDLQCVHIAPKLWNRLGNSAIDIRSNQSLDVLWRSFKNLYVLIDCLQRNCNFTKFITCKILFGFRNISAVSMWRAPLITDVIVDIVAPYKHNHYFFWC